MWGYRGVKADSCWDTERSAFRSEWVAPETSREHGARYLEPRPESRSWSREVSDQGAYA